MLSILPACLSVALLLLDSGVPAFSPSWRHPTCSLWIHYNQDDVVAADNRLLTDGAAAAARAAANDKEKEDLNDRVVISRRNVLTATYRIGSLLFSAAAAAAAAPSPVGAYTPDPDPLRESLYLVSRVQEATCLQERYMDRKIPPIAKMKLTLRLVDRSYRLLDQVNYISKFIRDDDILMATQLGNEAAESLQEAIDFVYALPAGSSKKADEALMTPEQRDVLKRTLTETREKLFDYLDYVPDQDKVMDARKRVEEENRLNQDEFDPDLSNDAGVYNPVVLPWKLRMNK